MTNSILEWANLNSGALALFALITTLLSPVIGWLIGHYRGVKLDVLLRDTSSRPALIERYGGNGKDAYFSSVRSILHLAEQTYGKNPLSWTAFQTCILISMVYPLAAILLAWVLFNVWTVGDLEIFRDIESVPERLLRTFGVLLGFTAAGALVFYINQISGMFEKSEKDNGKARTTNTSVLVSFIVIGLSVLVSGGVAAIVVGTAEGAVALASIGAAILTFLFLAILIEQGFALRNIITACLFFFVIFSAAIFALRFAGGIELEPRHISLILLLYVFLPVLNGIADAFSLWITRSFLSQIIAHRPVLWWILGQMILDLILAACCLVALVGGLIGGLILWEGISPSTLPLDWRLYYRELAEKPKTGLALYAMILTTLIPTLIHLVTGLGAVWTQKARALRSVSVELAAIPADQPLSEVEVDTMLKRIARATMWGYARAFFVVGVLFVVLIWAGLSAAT